MMRTLRHENSDVTTWSQYMNNIICGVLKLLLVLVLALTTAIFVS
jgi:hypothetical protein